MLLGVLHADGGLDRRAGRGHAAAPLPRAAADEFHVSLRRPAEAPDRRREPARVRRPVRGARAETADRRAGRRIRPRALLRAAVRQPVGRPAHARVARQGAAQPSPRCCCSTSRRPRSTRTSATGCARYLEAYQRESRCTMLLASHNMGEVERMCDDVIMMREGSVVDQGSPRDLVARYGRENMEEVFLDIARGVRATSPTGRPRRESRRSDGTLPSARLPSADRRWRRRCAACARSCAGMPTCCSSRGRGSCRWPTTRP